VLLLALAPACATTELTSVWMDSEYAGGPLKTVMVIGLAREASGRRIFEDTFVKRLAAHGVEGIASDTLLPDVAQVRRETVEQAIQGRGVDAVIVTQLVGVETQQEVVQPVSRSDLYGHWGGRGVVIYEPGYTVERTIVNLETNLYEAASAKLIWTARSQSFDPASRKELIETLVEAVVKDLLGRGLLAGS
jgi:hypothetical protein